MLRRTTVLFLTVLACGFFAPAQEEPSLDVPFVPTPEAVVEEMLKLANIKKGDVLYDLGSGDGRIVIAAAKKFGIRGVGIDLNPTRIQEAQANAKNAGVASLVTFKQLDLFQADISKATVVTMYLLPSVNLKLKPKLLKDLRPGTRLISHDFDMGDWKPEKTVEKDGHRIYLWTIPAHASGQ